MNPELYRFRIVARRGKWRVETWDAEPPYGPAWQPALTGCESADEARTFFDTATVLRWDPERLSGHYSFGTGVA